MMSKINIWAQGIVIATIIATVIQLILPENKNKKYIKIVVGIYILFCIIHPVIGKSINLDDYNLKNYVVGNDFDEETGNSNEYYGTIKSVNEKAGVNNKNSVNKNGEEQYTNRINDEFKKRLINDIGKKLNTMGYNSENISVDFDNDYNITHLEISNIKKYNNEEGLEINEVKIFGADENVNENNVNNNDAGGKSGGKNNDKEDDKIKESDRNKLKKYFSDVYKVSENEIEIS